MSRIKPPASDMAVGENLKTSISTLPKRIESRPTIVAAVTALTAMRRRSAGSRPVVFSAKVTRGLIGPMVTKMRVKISMREYEFVVPPQLPAGAAASVDGST